jgi:hypothetical protein
MLYARYQALCSSLGGWTPGVDRPFEQSLLLSTLATNKAPSFKLNATANDKCIQACNRFSCIRRISYIIATSSTPLTQWTGDYNKSTIAMNFVVLFQDYILLNVSAVKHTFIDHIWNWKIILLDKHVQKSHYFFQTWHFTACFTRVSIAPAFYSTKYISRL